MIKNHGKKHLAGGTLAIIAIALLGCATFSHSEGSASSADAMPATSANGPQAVVNPTPSLASQLIGTWILEHENGPQSNPSGVGIRMKNFTGTHWNITQPNPKTGLIVFYHGGTYKIEGDKYFEHVDFATGNTEIAIGTTGEFTLKIEGDKLIQTGVNNDWNEVWKRAN